MCLRVDARQPEIKEIECSILGILCVSKGRGFPPQVLWRQFLTYLLGSCSFDIRDCREGVLPLTVSLCCYPEVEVLMKGCGLLHPIVGIFSELLSGPRQLY